MEQLPSVTPITTIVLAQLCRSPSFQIRQKLCASTVNKYAAAIKAGQQLPPLQVAVVAGVPCLVDGYHRAAALEVLGNDTADAIIYEATQDEAQWMAAKANMQHGLPLKPREVREVFKVYIRTKRHRKGRGKLKTYREISAELGRSHNTIRNWMKADFPKLFRIYGDNGNQGLGDGGIPLRLAAPVDAQPTLRKLEEVMTAFQATCCPAAREAIQQALKETSEEILKDWREPESDF